MIIYSNNMRDIITKLIHLADKLDRMKQFDEANQLDKIINKETSPISKGYNLPEYDRVQTLPNL